MQPNYLATLRPECSRSSHVKRTLAPSGTLPSNSLRSFADLISESLTDNSLSPTWSPAFATRPFGATLAITPESNTARPKFCDGSLRIVASRGPPRDGLPGSDGALEGLVGISLISLKGRGDRRALGAGRLSLALSKTLGFRPSAIGAAWGEEVAAGRL